jgi:hypothetical protein
VVRAFQSPTPTLTKDSVLCAPPRSRALALAYVSRTSLALAGATTTTPLSAYTYTYTYDSYSCILLFIVYTRMKKNSFRLFQNKARPTRSLSLCFL